VGDGDKMIFLGRVGSNEMRRNVFFKLLPILILYFVVFLVFAQNSIDYGDEARYAAYAENLTRGFYAPPDTLLLWNGPGYPLLLVPFAFFNIPWIYAKMLNPVFMFLACCFVYATLRVYMPGKRALFFSYLFALYPPFYAQLWLLLTESFVLMLVTAFILVITKWFETGMYRFMVFAAAICAYVALTSVFFGYVILACLLLALLLSRRSLTCRKSIAVYGIALLLCTPYLFYTYRLTGKVFYWANSGGSCLYWMTSPYPEEFGNWFSDETVMTRPELARHREFFSKLASLDYVRRDEILKKQALENLKSNPPKVILNWVSNLGRMWLNFPFSYKYQHPRTLPYMVPNSLLLAAVVFCIYPLVKLRRILPAAIIHSIGFCLIFLAGHSLLYAEARYLCPVVPFIFIVIAYTATNLIRLQTSEPEKLY
jgi:hypothetical protein